MTAPSLAILMPALNEQACIRQAVLEAAECGRRLQRAGTISSIEVVVVDDGSTDRTPEILEELGAEMSELVTVRHERNRGLGAAIRTGLDTATSDLVFYTDSDLPVDLVIVDDALALLHSGGHDVVSAYRVDHSGEGTRRLVYSIAYNALVRGVLGLRIRDVNFAAKLVRRDALDGIHLRSEGSFIDAELLGRLSRRGAHIAQLPAEYRPRSRGVSTLSSAGVVARILHELAVLTPGIRRERAPVRRG